MQSTEQNDGIDKLHKLLPGDDAIIFWCKRIRKTSETKIKNSTFSVTDLMRDMLAEGQATQNKWLHEVQWFDIGYSDCAIVISKA